MDALVSHNPHTSRRPYKLHRGRHVAYTVAVPPGFKPADAGDVPDELAGAEVLASHLSMTEGIAVVRSYNADQLERGLADGRWAVLVFRPKVKGGPQA
jgi:hypothetical protein